MILNNKFIQFDFNDEFKKLKFKFILSYIFIIKNKVVENKLKYNILKYVKILNHKK